jgi:16S rRNA processing protein RimM
VLGRVLAPFGVRGTLRVKAFTADPEVLLGYRDLLFQAPGEEGRWQPIRIREGRRHGDGLVVDFEGIEDRDRAEGLKGGTLGVRRGELPAPHAGEIYLVDLIGAEVRSVSGERLGVVDGFLPVGDSQVMRVKGEGGSGTRERLVPFLEQYVVEVELGARRITVDWPSDL